MDEKPKRFFPEYDEERAEEVRREALEDTDYMMELAFRGLADGLRDKRLEGR